MAAEREVKVGIGITSMAFAILLVIFFWDRGLGSLLPSELFSVIIGAFAIGLFGSIIIQKWMNVKTDYNLMGITLLAFSLMIWAFVGDVAIGTIQIYSLIFIIILTILVGILIWVILYLMYPRKEKGHKSVRMSLGITNISFLILFLFLYWERTFGSILISEILWSGLIAFAIGYGVTLVIQIFMKHKTHYNMMGIVLIVFALLLWWLIGDVSIGTITMSNIVYVTIVTTIIAVVLLIVLNMIIN